MATKESDPARAGATPAPADTLNDDEAPEEVAPAPRKQASADAIKEAEETEPDYVAVSRGYGKVTALDKCMVDGYWFVNGIARDVPLEQAKAWKKLSFGKSFVIHPNDATEIQIAERCGVQRMRPQRLAVQMAGSDLHAVASEMPPETLERIILDLAQHLPSTHPLRPRSNSGRR